jgi:hypothetical protein
MPDEALDPGIIHRIGTGYMASGALFAALDLDVFDTLEGNQLESAEVAARLGLAERHIERLLVALTALQLVRREHGRYRNTPLTSRYLVKRSPNYFGDYYRYQSKLTSYPYFGDLAKYIRSDAGVIGTSWPEIMADPERARVFILGQHSASLGGGRQLARVFDFSPYRTLVDLAGGSGACAIAAAQRNPKLHAIVVDFPNVLRVTEELIAGLGLSDRIQTVPGDIMKDDFPPGDVILISLILSSYGPEDYVGLLRRVYAKLPSGGAIVIHDFVMNDDKTGPTITALYNLTAIDGPPYSGADIASMLSQAGFVDPQTKTVIPEYTGMVAARKP